MTDPKLRRRYVYIDDATWDGVRLDAEKRGITMSEVVRSSLPPWNSLRQIGKGYGMTDADHPADEQLAQTSAVRFNPAPKPVRKKR